MPSSSYLPVLMYHKVGVPVQTRRDRFLNVSPEGFRRQMRALSALRFTVRPFAEIVDALTSGKTLPARTAAITFDDGYQCIANIAAPILAESGLPATVFVVSQGAGRTNLWDQAEGNPELPLMNWNTLRHLQSSGWEMGGHTRTHPHLDALDDSQALADILAGKEEAEAELGTRLQTFCYPFGHYRAETPSLVRQAGFQGACTVRRGIVRSGMDPFLLPRVKVAYGDGLTGFLYRLLVSPRLPNLRPHRRSHQS